MRIRKGTNTKIVISVLIILILIAGSIAYAGINSNGAIKKQQSTQSKKSKQKNENNKVKTAANGKDTNVTNTNNTSQSNDSANQSTNKAPKRYEGGSIQNSPALTGSVDIATPVRETMLVRATINQLINDPNGTCDLTLTGPVGQVYQERAKLLANPQTSTCYGWDIPVSKLGQIRGHWTIKIVANGSGRNGTLTGEANL